MKILFASLTALALLASAPVLAQSAPQGGGGGAGSMPPAAGSPPAVAGGSGIIASQTNNEILAKDLLGSPVTTPDGKKVGVVKDLLLDSQGRLSGLVIASGSFLGMGGKAVGVSASKVSIESAPKSGKGDDTMVLVRLTQSEITGAPEFKSVEDMIKSAPAPAR